MPGPGCAGQSCWEARNLEPLWERMFPALTQEPAGPRVGLTRAWHCKGP